MLRSVSSPPTDEPPAPPRVAEPICTIPIDHEEPRVAADVLLAFAASKRIFQRAGFLVEPRLDPARRIPGLLRPTDELKMVRIRNPRARSLASELCRFTKDKKDVSPPEWLAANILSLPDWPDIPVVESVSENPTFRSDGTIHDVPGYDAPSGNYFAPDGVEFPSIPENPSRDDALAAWEMLADPLHDFPFVTDCDRSVSFAIILTLLARPAIGGPTPPFVISTPTPRTGKDLLTDVVTTVGTGRPTAGRTLPRDDTEMRKVLLSIALSGVRVVSFGNCVGTIGSPAISHAVTREVLSDRLLGENTDETVSLRTVFLFNGNNPRYKEDFAPRVVVCRMDAQMVDPQARNAWRYSPLVPHVRRQRPALVAAGLTILRAYHLAGRPRHGKSRKGSFEEWDDLVRGAIIWLGKADPLDNDASVHADDDADLEQIRALLVAWQNAFGDRPMTLADAVDASRPIGAGGTPIQSAPAVPGAPSASATAIAVAGAGPQGDEKKKNLAAAFAALDPKIGEKYTAAGLRYHFRRYKGRRVDVGEEGEAKETLRFEIDNPRAGTAKVATWVVLHAGEDKTPRQRELEAVQQDGPTPPDPPRGL